MLSASVEGCIAMCGFYKFIPVAETSGKHPPRRCLVDLIYILQHSYTLQTVEYFTLRSQSHSCSMRLEQHVC